MKDEVDTLVAFNNINDIQEDNKKIKINENFSSNISELKNICGVPLSIYYNHSGWTSWVTPKVSNKLCKHQEILCQFHARSTWKVLAYQ